MSPFKRCDHVTSIEGQMEAYDNNSVFLVGLLATCKVKIIKRNFLHDVEIEVNFKNNFYITKLNEEKKVQNNSLRYQVSIRLILSLNMVNKN